MTSQRPRIYLYKITFEEVSYYYYGAHKEKKFNEYYMGTPVTHKWMWKFYTPKKQILQFFDFTDEGWIEAQEVEKRLIKPFYNTDKWCLNENVGGKVFIDLCSKGGRKAYELGIGGHARTKEQMTKDGKSGGKKAYELGLGIHGRTKEQMSEDAKNGGLTAYKLGVGVHGRTKEQMSEDGKKATQRAKELRVGLYGLATEERRENVKITNSQRWECCMTGYVSTSAGVVSYQKGKGIDTSKNNRRRIS